MSKKLFKETITTLLEGKVICSTSHPDLFQYLNQRDAIDGVNLYINRLDLGVSNTSDQAGFYCTYQDTEERGVRRETINLFEKLATDWEALLTWLRLCRQVSPQARPIASGEIIKESELAAAIENSPDLQKDLSRIASSFRLRGRGRSTREELSGVIGHLKDEGFLVEVSAMTYIGTARWSMLEDQMQFIREQDGIENEAPENDEQEALF